MKTEKKGGKMKITEQVLTIDEEREEILEGIPIGTEIDESEKVQLFTLGTMICAYNADFFERQC